MLRLGITQNKGLNVSPLNVSSSSYSNIDAMHSTGDENSDDLSANGDIHATGRSDVDMLARQADVRTKPPSREVPTAAWPPLHPHGSKAWRHKVALVWRYHSSGIIPKNTWSSTSLQVTLTITALNVVTRAISSGATTGVLLAEWIVSCALAQRSRS